jgi:sugar (pentulose or hexulose) kinase
MYEGVAYNVRWLLDSVQDLFGFRPDPLRVIGGGAKSRPWVQIMADITGRKMEVAVAAGRPRSGPGCWPPSGWACTPPSDRCGT